MYVSMSSVCLLEGHNLVLVHILLEISRAGFFPALSQIPSWLHDGWFRQDGFVFTGLFRVRVNMQQEASVLVFLGKKGLIWLGESFALQTVQDFCGLWVLQMGGLLPPASVSNLLRPVSLLTIANIIVYLCCWTFSTIFCSLFYNKGFSVSGCFRVGIACECLFESVKLNHCSLNSAWNRTFSYHVHLSQVYYNSFRADYTS